MINYTIKAPRIKRQNLIIGPFKLRVQCSSSLPVPWIQLQPLVKAAWRHVTREAVREGRTLFTPLLSITNGNSWRGRAWSGAYQALVRIGDLHTAPRPTRYPRYKDMPEFMHNNWQEHLVGLCAHELWHLYSRKFSGREQEFECELVESDAIDFYRRLSAKAHNRKKSPQPYDQTDSPGVDIQVGLKPRSGIPDAAIHRRHDLMRLQRLDSSCCS